MDVPRKVDADLSCRRHHDHQFGFPGNLAIIGDQDQGIDHVSDDILGSTLWMHTSNELMRELYRQLVDRVLQTGESLVLPIYDLAVETPVRRWVLSRRSPNEVEITSQVERTVKQETLQKLTGDIPKESEEWVTMCSYCQSIQVAQDVWQSAHEAVTTLQLADRDVLPQLTHGVCPDCYHDVMSELDYEDDAGH